MLAEGLPHQRRQEERALEKAEGGMAIARDAILQAAPTKFERNDRVRGADSAPTCFRRRTGTVVRSTDNAGKDWVRFDDAPRSIRPRTAPGWCARLCRAGSWHSAGRCGREAWSWYRRGLSHVGPYRRGRTTTTFGRLFEWRCSTQHLRSLTWQMDLRRCACSSPSRQSVVLDIRLPMLDGYTVREELGCPRRDASSPCSRRHGRNGRGLRPPQCRARSP